MTAGERILLVEDDEGMRAACRKYLESAGFEVLEASAPQGAESIMLRERLHLILTDLKMPGGGGEAVVRKARSVVPTVPLIIITAYPTVQSAIESFKSGVVDYLVKPFTGEQLIEAAQRVLAERKARESFGDLVETAANDAPESSLLGSSAAIRSLLADIRRVAPSAGPVLVTGEGGLMKVQVARAIHRHSSRSAGPFVVASCGLLPPDLVQADLFGYATNTLAGRPGTMSGLAEEADFGTLFLDDVAELSLEAQALTLRMMEEGAVRRLGGTDRRTVNVRVVASTSKDLAAEVRAARFREDLFQLLSPFVLRVPALRDRREDIPILAAATLEHLNSEPTGKKLAGFTEDALLALQQHPWPGNLRELRVVIQRVFALAAGPLIGLPDLRKAHEMRPVEAADGTSIGRDSAVARFERQHISEALSRNSGNVSRTAEALGIHRTTLQRLMRRYGLERT